MLPSRRNRRACDWQSRSGNARSSPGESAPAAADSATLRRFLQRVVIERDGLLECLLAAGLGAQRRFQFAVVPFLTTRGSPAAKRRMIGRASHVASTQAAPQIRVRRHDQAWRLVVMDRARADEFRPCRFNSTPNPVNNRSIATSFLSRSISTPGILAMKTGSFQTTCQEATPSRRMPVDQNIPSMRAFTMSVSLSKLQAHLRFRPYNRP